LNAASASSKELEFSNNGTLLRIVSVQMAANSGRYTCTAINKVGRTDMDVFLDVIGKLIWNNLFPTLLPRKMTMSIICCILKLDKFFLEMVKYPIFFLQKCRFNTIISDEKIKQN
jgi:hypothetical protein